MGSSLSIWHWLILIVIGGLAVAFVWRPRRRRAPPDIGARVDPFAEWKALKAKKDREGLTAEEEARFIKLTDMLSASYSANRQTQHHTWSRQQGDDKSDAGFDPTHPREKD